MVNTPRVNMDISDPQNLADLTVVSAFLAMAVRENCSCHIDPPCSRCVDNPLTCPECGWEDEP